MSEWKPIVQLARRNLLALAWVALLCVAAVVGLDQFAGARRASLAQLRSATQEQQTQLNAKQLDLHNMQDHIQRFESLRTLGLIGTPDRALWVEQLQASYLRMGFGGRLSYQLQAPKLLATDASQAASADGELAQPLVHDLQFELFDTHEIELLNLIQDFRSQAKGRFRVNACMLQDPKESGLMAKCVLRFLTIPLPPPPAGQGLAVPAG